MKFLIIDTCIWLDLASKPPLLVLLQELQTALNAKVRKLVLPESVSIEYDRNIQKVSKNWVNSLDGHVKNLNALKPMLGSLHAEIDLIQKTGRQEIEAAAKSLPKHIETIKSIFSAAKMWEAQDVHFKDACDRTIRHRVPASNPQRSSVGDCLLWSAVLDCLDEGDVWFCTANSSDFAGPERKDQADPELALETSTKENVFRYFNNPTQLVEELLAEIPHQNTTVKPLPKYFDFVPTPPDNCPKCDGKFYQEGFYRNSAYGGLTLQYVCCGCGRYYDTGDFFD